MFQKKVLSSRPQSTALNPPSGPSSQRDGLHLNAPSSTSTMKGIIDSTHSTMATLPTMSSPR